MQPETKPRRALVLGCGGVAGAAWTVATLAELERALGWDARDADLIVGTSSGALVATLLAAGVPVSQMVQSQRGERSDPNWDDQASVGWRPPRPALRATAAGLLLRAVRGDLDPVVGLTGLLPRGRADMTGLRRLVRAAVGDRFWPSHPGLRVMVVDTRTGQRVALGGGDGPRISIVDAVCASYAIPGWCPPVTCDGVTYVDGGVASPTSADLVLGTDMAEAIVLAPMASGELTAAAARAPLAERALRRRMTRLVNGEVCALEQAGVRVARLTPSAEDLAAFGRNLMSGRRRALVFETATRTAKDAVADALLDFALLDFQTAGEPASARVVDLAAHRVRVGEFVLQRPPSTE
jgi:NTE family protein